MLQEQGFLCCYCQNRILLDSNTQIEHFIPRSVDALLMFDYENLLACCDGGQQKRTESNENQTIEYIPKFCGAAKDNDLLTINPLQNDCETHFDYVIGEDFEIEILGKTKDADNAIQVLNLNLPHLKRLRGNFIKNLITGENGIFLNKNDLLSIKRQILILQNGKFYPFCAILDKLI